MKPKYKEYTKVIIKTDNWKLTYSIRHHKFYKNRQPISKEDALQIISQYLPQEFVEHWRQKETD